MSIRLYNRQGRRVTVPRWAYHGTERDRFDKIRKQGLVPHADKTDSRYRPDEKLIYFSNEPILPAGWEVLLRFPWPLDAVVDYEQNGWVELVTRRPVPPEHVEVHVGPYGYDGEWVPVAHHHADDDEAILTSEKAS